MPRQKKLPAGTSLHECEVCGFVSRPLTTEEWESKRPTHESSARHLRAQLEKQIPNNKPSKAKKALMWLGSALLAGIVAIVIGPYFLLLLPSPVIKARVRYGPGDLENRCQVYFISISSIEPLHSIKAEIDFPQPISDDRVFAISYGDVAGDAAFGWTRERGCFFPEPPEPNAPNIGYTFVRPPNGRLPKLVLSADKVTSPIVGYFIADGLGKPRGLDGLAANGSYEYVKLGQVVRRKLEFQLDVVELARPTERDSQGIDP